MVVSPSMKKGQVLKLSKRSERNGGGIGTATPPMIDNKNYFLMTFKNKSLSNKRFEKDSKGEM